VFMSVKIRLATLDDAKDIVEVYCSSIDKWVKKVGNKELVVSYEELSVAERFAHGGPWMSIETLAPHLNYMLINGQYPLVAEVNGKVVGELELYIGKEPSPLGKTAFIDVLEVHKDYRGRGIGKALVNKAIEIAEGSGCDTISVWPSKEAIGFYEKCGLTRRAFNIVYLKVNLTKLRNTYVDYWIDEYPAKYSLIEDMVFISPRIESSFTAWIKSTWGYSIEERILRSVEGYVRGLDTVFLIESLWGLQDVARVFLWVRSETLIKDSLNYVLNLAKRKGFNSAILYVSNRIYEEFIKDLIPHEVIGKEIILAKRLK